MITTFGYLSSAAQVREIQRINMRLIDALETALLELHEVNLANRAGNAPRNPEMTAAAELKVIAVLDEVNHLR